MRALVTRYAAIVLAVVVLNFFLPRLLPGDPLDPPAEGAPLTLMARAELRTAYRLDQPLGSQFLAYLQDLTRADLGWSTSRHQPVAQLIGERLPWTLGLVLSSVVAASALGVGIGAAAAWRGGRLDAVATSLFAALGALPEFLLGMGLLLVFAVGLGWFPLYGVRSSFESAGLTGAAVVGLIWHLALPALTLVVAGSAAFGLVTRGAMRAVLDAPYLTAARARGLSEIRLAFGHALPNALAPVVALFGVRLGHVLGGALVVERLFSLPGLGLLAFQAIATRDYPVLQAVFLLGSLGVLLANFLVDAAELRHPGHVAIPAGASSAHGAGAPRLGVLAGVLIIVVAGGAALLAPVVAPFDPTLPSGPALLPPANLHVFGTNDLGQDLFSVWLWAARGSLLVAVLVAGVATTLAWTIGLATGLSARASWPLRLLTDLLLALPPLPLYLLALSLVGARRATLVLVLGLLAWPTFARMVHATVHAVREAPHVEGARALGATPLRIALVHLLPATLALIPATLVLTIRYALFAEATLAFLGLGDPTAPSWGTTLAWAFADPLLFIRGAWAWWALPPAVSIALVVLATAWLSSTLELWPGPRQMVAVGRQSLDALAFATPPTRPDRGRALYPAPLGHRVARGRLRTRA
ncbi:MAG: ABC transporter permease subunit [Chloroflexota bacterium]|nr:ABC transporter permease subunit [Chloroflexota bacterium]